MKIGGNKSIVLMENGSLAASGMILFRIRMGG